MTRTAKISIAGGVVVGLVLVLRAKAKTEQKKEDAESFRQLLRETIIASSLGALGQTAFNPEYLKNLIDAGKQGIPILTPQKAKELAKDIADAWSWYNDNEAAIYGVFEKLNSRVKVSQVAKAYLEDEDTGLLGDLMSKLSEEEFTKIKARLNKLKDY